MFMVASSCITTIMILNYHHRLADTHEMPEWVIFAENQIIFLTKYFMSGTSHFPSVDPLAPENVQTRRKDHEEDNHDGSEDEGPGHEGDVLQVLANKCAGHGR